LCQPKPQKESGTALRVSTELMLLDILAIMQSTTFLLTDQLSHHVEWLCNDNNGIGTLVLAQLQGHYHPLTFPLSPIPDAENLQHFYNDKQIMRKY